METREHKSQFGLVEKDKKKLAELRILDKKRKVEDKRTKENKGIEFEYLTKGFVEKYGKELEGKVTFSDLLRILVGCNREEELLVVVKCLRKVLQAPGCKFCMDFDEKVIKMLIGVLKRPRFSVVVLDCLINVSVFNARKIADIGGIEEFIKFGLSCVDENVIDRLLWVLANIASDSVDYRDQILSLEGLELCFYNLDIEQTVQNSLFCISCLCRGKPYIQNNFCQQILDKTFKFLDSSNESILKLICDILYSCTSYPDLKLNEEFSLNYLLKLLSNPKFSYMSLKIINNILISTQGLEKKLIDLGILKNLDSFFDNSLIWQQKEILLMILNLLSGGEEVAKSIIKSQILVEIWGMISCENLDVKIDILTIMSIVSEYKSGLAVLLTFSAFEKFINCFQVSHPDVIAAALPLLKKILLSPRGQKLFIKFKGPVILNSLKLHPSKIISHLIEDLQSFHNFPSN